MGQMMNKVKKTDLKALVRKELCDYISRMDLNQSTKLPREEELCDLLGVSRITIRSVLEELSAEGLIIRRQGRGTFVNRQSMDIKVSFNPVMHFSDMITKSGYTPHIRILGYRMEAAGREAADMLAIGQGEQVLICEKFFYADRMICAYTKDYVPAALMTPACLNAVKDYDDSMFRFLAEQCGIVIVSDRVEINVVETREVPALRDRLEEERLQQKPYLLLKGVNYDADERRIMYGMEYVDTDIIKFSQIRKRNMLL